MLRRNKNRKTTLVSYKLDTELVNKFRSTSTFHGHSMSYIVQKLINEYLDENKIEMEDKMDKFWSVEEIEKMMRKK